MRIKRNSSTLSFGERNDDLVFVALLLRRVLVYFVNSYIGSQMKGNFSITSPGALTELGFSIKIKMLINVFLIINLVIRYFLLN